MHAANVPIATHVLVAWNGHVVRRPVLYEPAAEECGEHLDPGPPRLTIVDDYRGRGRIDSLGAVLGVRGPLILRRGP